MAFVAAFVAAFVVVAELWGKLKRRTAASKRGVEHPAGLIMVNSLDKGKGTPETRMD